MIQQKVLKLCNILGNAFHNVVDAGFSLSITGTKSYLIEYEIL